MPVWLLARCRWCWAGIASAAALALGVRGRWPRIAGVLGVSAGAGLALTAILQFWLGSLEGSYWVNAAVVALSIAATSSFVLGLEGLLGRAGLGLGAALMMLLGNPLSGLTSAPEMLPSGWGALGQLMPPGAAGTAVRSVSFFDGAGAAPRSWFWPLARRRTGAVRRAGSPAEPRPVLPTPSPWPSERLPFVQARWLAGGAR